jgi:hypothetical protein
MTPAEHYAALQGDINPLADRVCRRNDIEGRTGMRYGHVGCWCAMCREQLAQWRRDDREVV